MQLSALAENLERNPEGIWISSASAGGLSYPEEGNREYFRIEDRSFWFRHRNDCIVSAFKLHPPDGPVLDIGGGNGFVTRRLIDEGFNAALLEPGPVGALNARTKRQIPDVICAKLGDCGFPKGSISAVSMFDVLEHIEDDRAFLAEIHEYLKPGGRLYLTVPAFKWLWSGSDISAGHVRRYNPADLLKLLDIGYDISFMTCIFKPLVLPMVLLRILPYRLGLSRRSELLNPETEHGTDGGTAARAIERLLSREPKRILSGESIGLGSSCLCSASKRIQTGRHPMGNQR